jgi:hypothetical protein
MLGSDIVFTTSSFFKGIKKEARYVFDLSVTNILLFCRENKNAG